MSPWLLRSLKFNPKPKPKPKPKPINNNKDKNSKDSKNGSSRSNTYKKYKEKIEEGSPLSFGGGSRTEKQHRYRNVEYIRHGRGRHTVRRVHIVGGKGHKSVTTHKGTAKKALSPDEIKKICKREFIPGLFDDCVANKAK